MKKLSLPIVIFQIALISGLLHSCQSECFQTVYYTARVPVYKHIDDIRTEYQITQAKEIGEVSRVVAGTDMVFLLEEGTGVHVIDNSDSRNPKKVSFIEIGAALDIELSGNLLYVVQATDLITLDVSNLNSITKVGTTPAIFNSNFMKGDSFVVDHTLREVVREVRNGYNCADQMVDDVEVMDETRDAKISVPYAQLHARGNFLYSCDHVALSVFAINGASSATFINRQTVLNLDQYNYITSGKHSLYVGAASFMAEFDLRSNPSSPSLVRFFGVSASCNRFTALDTFLFVPGFGGRKFGFCTPQPTLDIFQINSLLRSQQSVARLVLSEAQDVTFQDSLMAVSNGNNGIVLFDVSDPVSFSTSNNIVNTISGTHSARTFLVENHLLSVGDEGLSQFDVSNPQNILMESVLK